jgi:dienelactone hydrolase
VLALTGTAEAFDPVLEAKNFAKTTERQAHITLTPEFQARFQRQNVEGALDLARILAEDPGRVIGTEEDPTANGSFNLCATYQHECAGDVRFYEWEEGGAGIVHDVLFTARDGATITGRVWATETGPAERPAIVITTGSVQAPQTLYWGLAATLAKHGYVVLTYDVQGQGRSDTLGAGPDLLEGVPAQAGQPFYDGTEDALDFLLSTPADPYDPRPSCGNSNGGVGTDHSGKQRARVDAGLNSAFNPLWERTDPQRVGIAGHSLGASAVSYVGQIDDRVDAIAAWDNLSPPGEGGRFAAPDCPSGSAPRPANPLISKPGLGISNDYGIVPTPNLADPGLESHNDGYQAYTEAGVDSMQVNIRGGTHEESAFLPGSVAPVFGLATLRGQDMVAWYTTAWFDKHVKCPGDSNAPACEAEADARLQTDRWRDDAPGRAVDLNGDGNLYSFYLRSRYDFLDASGDEVACDDMRAGCSSMGPDGLPLPYSLVADAHRPDDAGGDANPEPCALPQAGTDKDDDETTLPPTDGGDAIRGEGGDDRLRGAAGDDCLYGNEGDDDLRGGQGSDELRGGAGNDRLGAAEGEADVVSCGPGEEDHAVVDELDTTKENCERVTFSESPPPPPPA